MTISEYIMINTKYQFKHNNRIQTNKNKQYNKNNWNNRKNNSKKEYHGKKDVHPQDRLKSREIDHLQNKEKKWIVYQRLGKIY
jgi:hypothetical protein